MAISASVQVGQTITIEPNPDFDITDVRYQSGSAYSTAVVNSGDSKKLDITGVAEGTSVVELEFWRMTDTLTIEVTPAAVDDQNFLNERGLAHFWQGVDAAKQDKLPTGTVLTTRTELYNNNSGSAANIAVSQALNKFDQVEFWFIDANSPANQLIRTIPGDAAGVVLDIPHPGGNSGVFWNIARWTWTAGATTLTYSSNHYQKALAASSLSTSSTNYILIRKVVGIKFTTL